MHVRFVLPYNLPGSMTRITAETAMTLTGMGIKATVLFPAVDWWDYKRFTMLRLDAPMRWKWIARLAGEALVQVPFRRRWCGFEYHRVDSRVRAGRFLLSPSAIDWPDDAITVVHAPYLVPHLLRTIPHRGTTLVSALHMNLERAMNSAHPETAAWYRHWVARERCMAIPRYATSEASRQAAERLGIPIRRVIYDGSVDLNLFRPHPRSRGRPLVVTLYCDPNIQKGQAIGVEAIQAIRLVSAGVRFCALGRVNPAYAKVFDRNYGYLRRESFVQALQESDIFVYPSLYDGFPAPPLQAMACGAAVVTTTVEGVIEYAEHERNALLCDPGDAGGIAQQIVRLIEDQELRQRLQMNGPMTAQQFSVERSARELVDFLTEVADEDAPACHAAEVSL